MHFVEGHVFCLAISFICYVCLLHLCSAVFQSLHISLLLTCTEFWWFSLIPDILYHMSCLCLYLLSPFRSRLFLYMLQKAGLSDVFNFIKKERLLDAAFTCIFCVQSIIEDPACLLIFTVIERLKKCWTVQIYRKLFLCTLNFV